MPKTTKPSSSGTKRTKKTTIRPDDKAKETIKSLKAKLRQKDKYIKQLEEQLNAFSELFEQPAATLTPETKRQKDDICPSCGEAIVKTPAGIYIIESCSECTWRKRKRI